MEIRARPSGLIFVRKIKKGRIYGDNYLSLHICRCNAFGLPD